MGLEPLDFRLTLDLLASWEGHNVLVTAHSRAAGEPLSHSHTVLHGQLGPLEMVDNAFEPDVESAAGYAVGGAPSGLYMTAGDFMRAERAGLTHLTVKCSEGFCFEIRRLD